MASLWTQALWLAKWMMTVAFLSSFCTGLYYGSISGFCRGYPTATFFQGMLTCVHTFWVDGQKIENGLFVKVTHFAWLIVLLTAEIGAKTGDFCSSDTVDIERLCVLPGSQKDRFQANSGPQLFEHIAHKPFCMLTNKRLERFQSLL